MEFAVSMPIFVALVLGIVEFGRLIIQANAIEKGLRAGSMFVARAQLPLDAASSAAITNLVQRGSVGNASPYLVDGWNHAGASVNVIPLADYVTNGVAVPVFQITATVPFVPIVPGLPQFTITRSQQQAYVGR